MTTIKYQAGDATRPSGVGHKIIAHCCNDMGIWGDGFVMSVSMLWAKPEKTFRRASQARLLKLGDVQFVDVRPEITIANIIGQHGVMRMNSMPPIRYASLRKGLATVSAEAQRRGSSVHMPRIGAGRAGGDWDEIEGIIKDELCASDIKVTIYTLA